MLDIILGMVIVIKEGLTDLLRFLLGVLKVLFTKGPKTSSSRKNEENAFKELLARENYVVDVILTFLPFAIVSHYSIIAAPIVTFIGFFYIYNKKKEWYNNRNMNLPDESLIFSYITTVLLIIFLIIYINTTTPYTYEEIGKVTLLKNDITHHYIKIEINNKITDLNIKGCKVGDYKILKETINPFWVKVNKVDYYASCSKNIDIKKQIDGIDKIKKMK